MGPGRRGDVRLCGEFGGRHPRLRLYANGVAPSACDPFGVPRLTIRRSTSLAVFARVAHQQRIRLLYAPAHALTAGWAVVRRTRSGLRTLTNDLSSSTPSMEGVQ